MVISQEMNSPLVLPSPSLYCLTQNRLTISHETTCWGKEYLGKPVGGKDGRLVFLKNHVPQDGILAFFILKGEGIRSCFWLDSGKNVLIYSLTGGPGQDASVS